MGVFRPKHFEDEDEDFYDEAALDLQTSDMQTSEKRRRDNGNQNGETCLENFYVRVDEFSTPPTGRSKTEDLFHDPEEIYDEIRELTVDGPGEGFSCFVFIGVHNQKCYKEGGGGGDLVFCKILLFESQEKLQLKIGCVYLAN